MGTEATLNVYSSPSSGTDSAGVDVVTSSVNLEDDSKGDMESRSSSRAQSPKKNSISGESMENEVNEII